MVGSKLQKGFVASVLAEIDNRFVNLRPDIVIRLNGRVLMIETKTIGANIRNKENLYAECCNWLNERDAAMPATPYLLFSAGHERPREVRRLAKPDWKMKI